MNHVTLMGYMTRDLELRYTPAGKAMGNGAIGITRKWTSETGEKKEKTSFIDLKFYGRTAEVVAQYFRKGSPIIVEGRLDQDQWDDKQTGQKRYKLSVVVESFHFIPGGGDGKKKEAAAPNDGGPRSTRSPAPEEPAPVDDDSDVPF